MIELTDGRVLNGLVVREDARTIVLRMIEMVDRPIEISTSLVTDRAKSTVSMTPEGLSDELSQEQIGDLLAFLQSSPPS